MWQAILAESAPTFWLPSGASTVAGRVDLLFNVTLWICIFFFFLVTIMLVVFTIMYRHKPGKTRDTAAGHSTTLELTWTLIPSIIVVFLYYYGFRHYMEMTIEPPNSYEITANAKMWQWSFIYPTGLEHTELHVPIGTPIRVVLQSNDVIHSLYVPAFRVKKDVVPGRFNRMWFEATDLGTFDIYCAGYCGTNHSTMRSIVVVQTRADYEKWLKDETEKANNLPPVKKGEKLYRTLGCAQCHTLDGTRLVGPSWKDLWGKTETLTGGTKILVDKPYVSESILQPLAKIVDGYPPSMPPFVLKDNDIEGIIAFMKSISANTSATDRAALDAPASQPAGGPATQPAAGAPVAPPEKK
jgi:cytochrome c oxidase subunit 2